MPQVPIKHHFLPVFYLKQWVMQGDGIVEFSKPYKNVVKPKRVHPAGTGYIDRLYAAEGLSPDLACEMERDFLSPVDSRAADALAVMMTDGVLSEAQRKAWATFLASLMLRMPEDIRRFKELITEITETFVSALEPIYDAWRPEGEPRNFNELTRELMASAGNRALKHAQRLMSHEKLVNGLSAMEWSVVRFAGAGNELLTSDRPIIYTNMLNHEQSHVVVPVGPRHFFIAVQKHDFAKRLVGDQGTKLAVLLNRKVVEGADKYVYGTSDAQLRFVQNRMGTNRGSHLVDRVADLQRERQPELLDAIKSVDLEQR